MTRPVLIVGDVQGDSARLEQALAPYPEHAVDTVFLGDFFQGGPPGGAGGVRAARIARNRRNSRAVIGNHELFLLCVLQEVRDGWRPNFATPRELPPTSRRIHGGSLSTIWLRRRGDWADLRALADDPGLERWCRELPLMLMLDDGTLVQHCDGATQATLGADVVSVNATARQLTATPDGTWELFWHTVERRAFEDPARLRAHLLHFGARRLVHGHTPHSGHRPAVSHDGRVLSFDGRFSRYWAGDDGSSVGPIEATVGLLPPLSAALASLA